MATPLLFFAHVEALTSFGLRVRFVDNADAEDVMEAIDAGIPVLVGWLHQGNMLRGEPPMCSNLTCGHWSVLHGYQSRYSSDPSWLMTDPAGLPDIERGGHNPALSGYRVSVCGRLHFINVGKIKAQERLGNFCRGTIGCT